MDKVFSSLDIKKRELILNMPIISMKNGEKIGIVEDVVICKTKYKLEGIIISPNNMLNRAKVMNVQQIHSIGEYAIIVDNNNPHIYNRSKLSHNFFTGMSFIGIKIIDTAGNELGIINDIYLDMEDKSIYGFELTKGYFDDLLNGRCILPFNKDFLLNEEMLLVSNENNIMYSTKGGIKNLFLNKI